MLRDKHIHRFTVSVIALTFFLFFGYWSYRFGMFDPSNGTSGSSISALWGQFFASLLATLALCFVLFVADLRQKPTHTLKLVSWYLLVVTVMLIGYLVWKDQHDYGKTHTYQPGQEFSYLNYKFTVDSKLSDVNPQDCSGLNDGPSLKDSSDSYGWLSFGKAKTYCVQGNASIASKKEATLTVVAKNTLNEFRFFSPAWFELTSSTGEIYRLTFANNGGLNQIPPNGQITANLEGTNYLSKDETIYSIKLKIDDHAEQVIKLP